jgi:hypothetical protein
MDILHRPPQWLNDLLPEAVRDVLAGGGWYVVVGLVGLVVLLIVWRLVGGVLRSLLSSFRSKPPPRPKDALEEDLAGLPQPAGKPGPKRLTVDGVPVRVRLVVVAAAGKEMQVNAAAVDKVLDRVLPGLGAVANQDRPAIRVWPPQLSYQGFGVHFHRCTPLSGGDDEPTPWVFVAGRAKIGTNSVLVGLGLWADEVTNIPRKTLEPHEWGQVLRLQNLG